MTEVTQNRIQVLQVGPKPPPTDGGILAYIEGMLASPLTQRYDMPVFDVRVPENARRHRSLRWLLSVRFLLGFRRILHRRPIDLVHLHSSAHLGFWERAVMAKIARWAGKPYVLHIHGGDFDTFLNGLSPWQHRRAMQVFAAADGVIVLSESWKKLFESSVDPDRLFVVPNAISIRRTTGRVARQQELVRILFVGMFSARKGLNELCKALTTLLDEGVRNFHVDLLGGEEYFGETLHFHRLFKRAGLSDWVTFQGLKLGAERDTFYDQADISVLPSRSESFGISNLEAMASGLPVISTRTGAIPEYLEHDKQGLLIEPGDVEALTQALRRLIADPALRRTMGAAAKERAQLYDWKVLWTQVDAVYRRALGAPPA